MIEQAYWLESGRFDLDPSSYARSTRRPQNTAVKTRLVLFWRPSLKSWLAATVDPLIDHFSALLEVLRTYGRRFPSYAGGSILNLLLHLDIDVARFDFSRICVWQANLRGISAEGIDFSDADLARSTFTDDFGHVKAIAFGPDNQILPPSGPMTISYASGGSPMADPYRPCRPPRVWSMF